VQHVCGKKVRRRSVNDHEKYCPAMVEKCEVQDWKMPEEMKQEESV
jgi:mRNA-degrading endonuclease HigB of HigAB toxin-antitoxin module